MQIYYAFGTYYATSKGKFIANGSTHLEAIKNCLALIFQDKENE